MWSKLCDVKIASIGKVLCVIIQRSMSDRMDIANGEKKKMNKVWVVIRLGKWRHKATSMYLYDRVYKNGGKWTPFCLKSFRYVGG